MTRLDVSRRHFLAGAAAAAAFPAIIPASALGDARKRPASERVTLGHIGCGGRGTDLFKGFQTLPAAQSVAVADPFQDRREARAAACRGTAYRDFRDLLARDDIDAVVVATPDHWHVPIALLAARAGKDCYVEKPLGLSIEQDLACRKEFEAAGRVFQYGTQQRSSAHCRLGCRLVRAGKIGTVKRIEVVAPNGGTGGSTDPAAVPEGFDYDLWLGPAPEAPYTVDRCKPQGTYWIYDQSIGYLGGWGAHPLDILVWGTDVELSGPITVAGTGKIPDSGLYDTVYDWDMTLTLPNDVTITFKPGKDATRFIGTEGYVHVEREFVKAEPTSLLETAFSDNDPDLMVSTDHGQNFLDAVLSRGATVSPVRDAVRSDILSHLCDIAVRLGRPVTWDPKAERFVDDSEADAMTRRPMRSPWTL